MINLKFQFKPFISMAVQHEYYPKGENNEMYFLPTPRTASNLEKMAMMIRPQDGALKVLFDVSKMELLYQRLSQATDNDLKLSFLLFSRNPYFLNFTDIPVEIQNKVFYFSNAHLKDNFKGQLHENDFVDATQLTSVNPLVLADNEEGKNKYSYAVDRGTEANINKIQHGRQIDTTKLLDGYYRIFANDKELTSFINLGAKTKQSPIGFVDIFLSGKMKAKIMKSIDNGELPDMNYKLNFNARSIYWRYNVVPLHTKRIKNLKVNCNKGNPKISFKGLGEFEYNENRMHSFISEKPVKFNKQYDYEIQLKKQEGESGGKVLMKKLAFASFDIIKPMNETDYMSEIYVYI